MACHALATTFNGEQAICLRAGQYEAYILPHIGANLIAFRDVENHYQFLHEPKPEEMEQFKQYPMIHGIPVLFPPNRYQDGKFAVNGKTYRLPVNEPGTGNHLHGFLYNIPWQVAGFYAGDAESSAELVQHVNEQHGMYSYFPHHFTITLRYTLTEAKLIQHVAVKNMGPDEMPCMLGFHTSINAPFAPGSTADDCTLTLTIGKRWELDERMLPTGKFAPLDEHELAMKSTGVSPYFAALDHHYTADAQNGSNRMELADSRAKVRLVYDVGEAYRHWMLYNGKASREFFCPEPQIGMVNAPNVDLPPETTGLCLLKPNEVWEASSHFVVEQIS
ncbi:MAG TPA: aldose 1-epimerase [Bacilli bacterium]